MDQEELGKAVELANRLRHVFLGTVDRLCMPHLTAANQITLGPDGRVNVAGWFCPGTVGNLKINAQTALVIWDPAADRGYQLLGRAEGVEELGILDGYLPEVDDQGAIPQVNRLVRIRVEKMLEFKHGPHSDREI